MSHLITPTVGRIVHYFPCLTDIGIGLAGTRGEPLAAQVAKVWDDRCVNLMVTDANGKPQGRTSVLLVQPGDEPSNEDAGGYCRWMPYQLKKRTGSESGEPSAGSEQV